MNEVWAPIPSAPGYAASNTGAIVGPRGLLKTPPTKRGYLTCSIRVNGAKLTTTVQRLVLEAFAGPPPTSGHEANHKNGVKTNNTPENLEWMTRLENMRHAIDTGLITKRPKKEKQPTTSPGQVLQHWTFEGASGWAHDVQLLQPADSGTKRPRSDQFVLVVDGSMALPLAGLTEIMDYLRTDVLPAQITRIQRRQDELDAAAS